MSLTFLQICERVVSDHGIAGGSGPSAVTAQVGELGRIVNFVADAAESVDNMWQDWKYLWVRYTGTMTIGSYAAPAPAGGVKVRLWHAKRMKIREPGGDWTELEYVPREEFEDSYDPDNSTGNMPSVFTINPDNTISFDCKADVAYELKGEFWRRPVRLSANGDVPLIPGEYWRIIAARALIAYGTREDAPEIVNGAEAEFVDVLDKLESDQLEDQERRRSSTDRNRASGFRSPL